MNPFDQPPAGTPVSADPPSVGGHGGHETPRRGRMALAALAAAGLVGGGIVVAGQFASADDRPSLAASDTTDEIRDQTTDEPTPDAPSSDEGLGDVGLPSIDGEIVLDDGSGEPLVIDLGAIAECFGPIFGGGPLFGPDGEGVPPAPFDDEFAQRMEEFLDGLPLDELGELDLDGLDLEGLDPDDGVRIFGSGGSMITVVGPDGVELIDLGEGDATVTIDQTDGELTIETDGDATVSDLPAFGDLGELGLEDFDLGELGLGEWQPLHELPFLDDIRSCLDDEG